LAHFWKAEILANPTAHEVKSLVVLMEKSRGSHAKLFQQLDLPPITAYPLSVLSLIFCPRSSSTVDSRLLEYLSNNWCEFVLKYFILAIKKLRIGKLKSLYGNMLLPVVSKEDQNNTC
jgi:hypothetical protein